jgi:hypothetical protein
MRISFNMLLSPETPELNKYFYNSEEQHAQLLSLLASKEYSGKPNNTCPRPIIVSGPQEIVQKKLVLHSSRTLAFMDTSRQVEVIWLTGYPNASYIDIARRFYSHLSQNWSRKTNSNEHASLGAFLAFEHNPEALSPEQYVEDNLKTLISLYGNNHIICVLDLFLSYEWSDETLEKLWRLFKACQQLPQRSSFNIVALTSQEIYQRIFDLDNDVEHVQLHSMSDEIISKLHGKELTEQENFRIVTPQKSERAPFEVSNEQDDRAAHRLLHSMVSLHQPASHSALEQLVGSICPSKVLNEDLLSTGAFKQTLSGLSVTPEGFQQYRNHDLSSISKEAIFGDHVPNSGKILMMSPPEQLLKLHTKFDQLSNYLQNRNQLVDTFAAAIVGKTTRHKNYLDILSQLKAMARNENDLVQENSATNAQTVLAYLSHLLIRDKFGLDHKEFDILEALTFGFVHYLENNKSRELDNALVGAEWMKNLNYVFSLSKNVQRFLIQNNNSNKENSVVLEGRFQKYAQETVKYLKRALPLKDTLSPTEQANLIYHQGWETYDAGQSEEAQNVMFSHAEDILKTKDTLNYNLAFELGIQGFLFQKTTKEASRFDFIFKRVVDHLGCFVSAQELSQYIRKPSKRLLPWGEGARNNHSKHEPVAILFSLYDLSTALWIASYHIHYLGKEALLVPFHDNIDGEYSIESVITNTAASRVFIIGGPTTPHGLNKFVSRNFPAIVTLFQIEKFNRCPFHAELNENGKPLTLITGRGICATYDAWSTWKLETDKDVASQINQTYSKRKILMIEVLMSSFVTPFLMKAQERVSDVVIDILSSKIRQKLESSPDKISASEDLRELQKQIVDLRDSLSQISIGFEGNEEAFVQKLQKPEVKAAIVSQWNIQNKAVETAFLRSITSDELPEFLELLSARVQVDQESFQLSASDMFDITQIIIQIINYLKKYPVSENKGRTLSIMSKSLYQLGTEVNELELEISTSYSSKEFQKPLHNISEGLIKSINRLKIESTDII